MSLPDKILIFSLSNIGDVVLTCPVIDVLLRDFPQHHLDVIVGQKACELFIGHPRITPIIFNKQESWFRQVQWVLNRRQEKYAMTIDLRQTLFPLFFRQRRMTPLAATPFIGHGRFKHLNRLATVYAFANHQAMRQAFFPQETTLIRHEGYIVIAPGAADSAKRLDPKKFVHLAQMLLHQGEEIVWVGDNNDALLTGSICRQLARPTLNLAGKLNLRQLAFVLKRAKLALTHDSGPMHLASYLDVPLVVLWGPTDLEKYGPWSKRFIVIKGADKTMASITVNQILAGITQL